MTATTDGSPGSPTQRTPSASSTSEPDPVPSGGTEAAAQRAVQRAADHLLARQHPDGWWKGDLETNVTMDAEDLLLRQFLGIQDGPTTAATKREQSAVVNTVADDPVQWFVPIQRTLQFDIS